MVARKGLCTARRSATMHPMKRTYTPTIGLEVHAELKTKTKMFCNSANAPHSAPPNTHICPVCMGHPGTLPTVNKEAVRHVLLTGAALGGTLATYTEFDRKHYFYPDIPKGYQISQYAHPLVTGGSLAGVAIARVHLEEDTARSFHYQEKGGASQSVLDFNRAGVPLMELVTEPVLHDAYAAGAFARELQLLLRTLGVSDAYMEQGGMRVEANVSVSSDNTLGTKVEVKNLNSFRSVEAAIVHETARQIEVCTQGGEVVQETRGWDEQKLCTYPQRTKETAKDYRYFPCPDIPKLDMSHIEEFSLSRLLASMPELPQKKRKKYEHLGIPRNQIETLVASLEGSTLLDATLTHIKDAHAPAAANYLTTDVFPLLTEATDQEIPSAKHFAELIEMVEGGEITSRVAKNLLKETLYGATSPRDIAQQRGLLQEHSQEALTALVEEIVSEHPSVVADYRDGKEASVQFLVGQGMKKTKGAANPTLLREMLVQHINDI